MPGNIEVKLVLTVVHEGNFVSETVIRQNVELAGTNRRFRTTIPLAVEVPERGNNVHELEDVTLDVSTTLNRAVLFPSREETRRRADREPYWRLNPPDQQVRTLSEEEARLRSRSRDREQP